MRTKLPLQKNRFWAFVILTILVVFAFVLFSTPLIAADATSQAVEVIGGPDDGIINRIPKLEMYPCDDCHTSETDYHPTPRKLVEEHTKMKSHFARHEDDGWCLRCHKSGNYLKLTLISGKEISFNDAHLLCSECHSNIYKDWQHNEHGKRVGSWKGPRQVYSCTACHQAHEPKYKHLKAIEGPKKPEHDLWGL